MPAKPNIKMNLKRFALKNLSNRMQIFIASVILVTLPLTLLSIVFSNRTLRDMNTQYQKSLEEITNQVNYNIDTLLADADKLSYLHLINDDISAALNRNYAPNDLEFAKTSWMMRDTIAQAIKLNPTIINAIFINKYDLIYDYNFTTNRDLEDTLSKIKNWRDAARQDKHYTYIGPVQYAEYSNSIYKNIIPMVKILQNVNLNSEVGVLYLGINFDSISKLLENSKLPTSKLVFFDQDNQIFYSTDDQFLEQNRGALDSAMSDAILGTSEENVSSTDKISLNGVSYTVNTVYNETTRWKIAHFMDSSIINSAYRNNLKNFTFLFFVIVIFDLLLAFLISRGLTTSISKLCRQIDQCEVGNVSSINIQNTFSSRELQKVVDSYNRLNERLLESMSQNYIIRLNEKQMKLRMLRSQINPHFMYNTLNLVSSLANIHDIPEIKTIATSMSELLRYNLKSNSTVRLRDEINQIKRYIAIQQIRFPDKFLFECAVPAELDEIEIPVFILQPIIENAVGHGLDEKEQGGYVMINTYSESRELHILISDNGSGMESQELAKIRGSLDSDTISEINGQSSSSIGILNVHQRIQTYYGREYGLTIDSTLGSGTIVDIKLPLNQKPQLPSLAASE